MKKLLPILGLLLLVSCGKPVGQLSKPQPFEQRIDLLQLCINGDQVACQQIADAIEQEEEEVVVETVTWDKIRSMNFSETLNFRRHGHSVTYLTTNLLTTSFSAGCTYTTLSRTCLNAVLYPQGLLKYITTVQELETYITQSTDTDWYHWTITDNVFNVTELGTPVITLADLNL